MSMSTKSCWWIVNTQLAVRSHSVARDGLFSFTVWTFLPATSHLVKPIQQSGQTSCKEETILRDGPKTSQYETCNSAVAVFSATAWFGKRPYEFSTKVTWHIPSAKWFWVEKHKVQKHMLCLMMSWETLAIFFMYLHHFASLYFWGVV